MARRILILGLSFVLFGSCIFHADALHHSRHVRSSLHHHAVGCGHTLRGGVWIDLNLHHRNEHGHHDVHHSEHHD
jgi:hypothetical protein